MNDLKILDIFYKQIVPEAATGVIDCFMYMNIPFSTAVEDVRLTTDENISYDGIIVPNLNINNKKRFDSLLIKYVNEAKLYYREELDDYIPESFLEDELNARNNLVDITDIKEEYIIKYCIATLFANASFNDFVDPVKFLEERISMFNNKLLESSEPASVYLESIKAKLVYYEEISSIRNETPTRVASRLEYDDGYVLELPRVYMGKTDNNYVLYAIQKHDKNSNKDQEEQYIRQIRKGMYYKLKGAPEHFFVTIMLLAGLFNNEDILVNPILIERWNAKRIVLDKKELKGNDMSLEMEGQDNLQNVITNGLIRYFTKMKDAGDGIIIDYYPFDVDDKLHVRFTSDFISKSQIFNEINEGINELKISSSKK